MKKLFIFIIGLLINFSIGMNLYSQVNLEWSKVIYKGIGDMVPCSMAVDNNGNVFSSYQKGDSTFFVKYSDNGNELWHKSFKFYDDKTYMVCDNNNDLYVGSSNLNSFILYKIDKNGMLLWKKIYSGTYYVPEAKISGMILKNNIIYLGGTLGHTGTRGDFVIFKFNMNGDQTPGKYKAFFDANNLASGIYIYRLQTEYYSDTRKMVLLK